MGMLWLLWECNGSGGAVCNDSSAWGCCSYCGSVMVVGMLWLLWECNGSGDAVAAVGV